MTSKIKLQSRIRLKVKTKVQLRPQGMLRRIVKMNERNFSRSGAILRGIMRRRIRTRYATSASGRNMAGRASYRSRPGNSPHNHVRSGGLKNLLRWQLIIRGGVAVGVAIGSEISHQSAENVAALPGILERGGTSLVHTSVPYARRTGIRRVPARIAARPLARPALQQFQRQYAELWRDSFR